MKYNTFRTVVDIPEPEKRISYHTPCMLFGSCFTENIGQKLERLKFPVTVNPFGVLYNPLSIQYSLDILINKTTFAENNLFYHDGLWHSFSHHSDFSSPDKNVCLETINNNISAAAESLMRSSFVFITLGTARVYILRSTRQVVSNCHKLPEAAFERKLLSVSEIVDALREVILRLRAGNTGCSFIMTVSPIRHWKDGAAGNQLSKSILLVAVHELIGSLPGLYYFPSYEIVMDDLRDYRFYDRDMIHLNTTATEYIWEKFSSAWISDDSLPIMKEMEKLVQARMHVPFRPGSPQYRVFLDEQLRRVSDLEEKYPFLDLTREKEYFSRNR